MKKTTADTAVYIGGPLHGTTGLPNKGSARWSLYRSDEGFSIPTVSGQNEEHLMTRQMKRPTRYYRYIKHEGRNLYIHLPAYSRWLLAEDKTVIDRFETQKTRAEIAPAAQPRKAHRGAATSADQSVAAGSARNQGQHDEGARTACTPTPPSSRCACTSVRSKVS